MSRSAQNGDLSLASLVKIAGSHPFISLIHSVTSVNRASTEVCQALPEPSMLFQTMEMTIVYQVGIILKLQSIGLDDSTNAIVYRHPTRSVISFFVGFFSCSLRRDP